MRSSPVRTSLGAFTGVVLASAVVASPAIGQPQRGGGGGETVVVAQPGMRGMGRLGGGRDMFEPPVNSADLDRYGKILSLTPDQAEAAKALLEASMAEFQPAAKAARDKMEQIRTEFRESGDPSVWQGMGEIMADFRKSRTQTESMFMQDLQMLLSDDQAQRWPTVERTHRRERTLGRGLMSGERVDLIKIVDRMDLAAADRGAIGAVLEQYEVDLDRELVKRNEVYDQGEAQAQNLMADFQSGDMTRAQEMFAKGRDASKRVKDVNQRYARQLENLLPEGKRSAFSDEVKRESHPMIYRETYATRVLAAAEKFDDLDETQRSSLTALRDSHARELASLNAQLQAAAEERENNADMMQMFGGPRDGRTNDLRASRRELETSTVQRVRDLLTEAQREKLPERNEANEADGRPQFQRMEGPRRRRGGDEGGEGERPQRRRDRRGEEPAPATPPPPEPR